MKNKIIKGTTMFAIADKDRNCMAVMPNKDGQVCVNSAGLLHLQANGAKELVSFLTKHFKL